MLLLAALSQASSPAPPDCIVTETVAAIHSDGRYVLIAGAETLRMLDVVDGGEAAWFTDALEAEVRRVRAAAATVRRCVQTGDGPYDDCVVPALNNVMLTRRPIPGPFGDPNPASMGGGSARAAWVSAERPVDQAGSDLVTHDVRRGAVLDVGYRGTDTACGSGGGRARAIRFFTGEGAYAGTRADVRGVYFGTDHTVVWGPAWGACALRVGVIGACGSYVF